jgi:hypothetical protein
MQGAAPGEGFALVESVASSVSGIAGVGPVSTTGGRARLASQIGATVEASVAQNGVGFESGTGNSRGGANLPELVASTFPAQAFAQEGAAASVVFPVSRSSAQQAAAAYQSTTAQTEANGSAEVQVPGLPPRLASGRVLDLTA